MAHPCLRIAESIHSMRSTLPAQRTRYLKKTPEGVSEMCREMEIMRNKSREEGREEGRKEGRLEGRKEGLKEGELQKARETAANLYTMGLDPASIAKAVNISIDLVQQWLTPASA